MPPILALVIIATLLCATIIAFLRVSYWKEKAITAEECYDDLMGRALRAESEEARIKDEMNRWQAMLAALQGRPLIATLNDQQAQALIQSVQFFVSSNKSGAN